MTEAALKSAYPELADFALTCRPGWTDKDVRGAITAAIYAGWEFPRTLVEMARLIADPDAEPRHLLELLRDPLKRPAARTPGEIHERVEHLRAQLPQRGGDAA